MGIAVKFAVSVFLLAGCLLVRHVPADFAVAAALLFVLLLSRLIFGYRLWLLSLRLLIYVTVAFVVYLTETYGPVASPFFENAQYGFFAMLAVANVLMI